jgi:hypothetical protein
MYYLLRQAGIVKQAGICNLNEAARFRRSV